jgi:hypothetical protein
MDTRLREDDEKKMDPRIREDDAGKAPVIPVFSPSFLRRQESIPASLQRDFLFKVKAWQI